MKSVFAIAKINLKVNARGPVLAAVALCVLVPVFAGTANLDVNSAAVPLEMFVSLAGIILLAPVFAPEQNAAINDLVSSKYVDPTEVYLIRVIYSVVLTAALIGLFAVYMGIRNCAVTWALVLGTAADAVFLGALGMFASALCGNTVIGYMIPVLYYAVNVGMGARLKNFYLFSMAVGEYGPKLWLFWAGVLFAGLALLAEKVRRWMR